jgi:polyhydroxyalkanoate synthesis regulator phasin
LQLTLNTKAGQLITAINNNIPTPAPILAEPIIEGTTVTIAPELPEGYTANTWFYQVITDDPDAENPYAGGTYNTDGAPESIQLTGLTEGATYTIRIANWSGPVSQYTETVISIPAPQSSNLTGGGTVETPTEEPSTEEPTEEPVEEDLTTEEPVEEENTEEETTEEEPSTEETTEEESVEEESAEEEILTVEEIISVVEDLVADGNLTAEDAKAVLDALMADGEITSDEVNNLSDALSEDGTFTLAEKELVADALIEAADGEPVTASDIAAAGLEYRDLPPEIPVEVRTDLNGNPVVITAEVASALLTLESPAALVGAIAGCFNPDEAIEGLTEEQKCEVLLALASIGADMSPQERQKAKEVLVAAVLVGQIIVGSAMIRRR